MTPPDSVMEIFIVLVGKEQSCVILAVFVLWNEKSYFITFYSYTIKHYLPSDDPRFHMTKHSGCQATMLKPVFRGYFIFEEKNQLPEPPINLRLTLGLFTHKR